MGQLGGVLCHACLQQATRRRREQEAAVGENKWQDIAHSCDATFDVPAACVKWASLCPLRAQSLSALPLPFSTCPGACPYPRMIDTTHHTSRNIPPLPTQTRLCLSASSPAHSSLCACPLPASCQPALYTAFPRISQLRFEWVNGPCTIPSP